MEKEHQAQIKALRWLQGRAEDQLVKAFIQVHVEMLERIGYPIESNGTQIQHPKSEHKPKIIQPLKNQIDLEEALREKQLEESE